MTEMATIVKYNAGKPPYNDYPEQIVSPLFPASCCVALMERVGEIEREKGFPYYYRRCRTCGYTVRHFLPPKRVEGEILFFLERFDRNGNGNSGGSRFSLREGLDHAEGCR